MKNGFQISTSLIAAMNKSSAGTRPLFVDEMKNELVHAGSGLSFKLLSFKERKRDMPLHLKLNT